MRRRCGGSSGMTLVEVMVSTGILLVASVGIVYSFVKCIELDAIGRVTTVAVQGVKNKLEEVKASSFAQIYNNYNGATFAISGVTGRGVIYVNNSNSKLLQVKVVYCVQIPGGRVLGEDVNLNGVLNTGEDQNANAQIDSPIQMLTKIYG
ncbi:MAG: hypothetical protein V2A70_08680 [Candidatus Omnitrophota bacterium]